MKTDLYRHYKGGAYDKLHEAILEADKTHVVVYKCCLSGVIYVRPAEEFKSKFHPIQDMEYDTNGCPLFDDV